MISLSQSTTTSKSNHKQATKQLQKAKNPIKAEKRPQEQQSLSSNIQKPSTL